MKSDYLVVWSIAVEAESPEEAAREARRIQEDSESIAHVYDVYEQCDEMTQFMFTNVAVQENGGVRVDLDEPGRETGAGLVEAQP